MVTVNMEKKRTWYGAKRWVMTDTDEKPKTFVEKEEDAIFSFFYNVMRLSLIPGFLVFLLYGHLVLTEGPDFLSGGYFTPFLMGAGITWLINIPNLAIMLIRVFALALVVPSR